MKANELRLGNWVRSGLSNVQIDVISEYGQYNLLVSKCEPIPLTEEWLTKLGVLKTSYIEGITIFTKTKAGKGMMSVIEYDGEFSLGNYNLDAEIKYVHNLQNLYFALTGEEL